MTLKVTPFEIKSLSKLQCKLLILQYSGKFSMGFIIYVTTSRNNDQSIVSDKESFTRITICFKLLGENKRNIKSVAIKNNLRVLSSKLKDALKAKCWSPVT